MCSRQCMVGYLIWSLLPMLGFHVGKKVFPTSVAGFNDSMCNHDTRERFYFQRCVLMDVCFPGVALNDGQWHSVELNSRRGRLTITVDKEERDSSQASPSFPVTIESYLFFGGKTQFSCVIPCNYTNSSISEHKM